MNTGYSPNRGSCPSVDRGEAGALCRCFSISVSDIQMLHNQDSHFHFLHKVRWTSLPSVVRILNSSAKIRTLSYCK